MSALFSRLKERKLVQWALAYLAGAWVLLQVLDLIGIRFGWPDALLRSLIVLLAAGFFGALVLAWYHGEKGRQRVSGVELLMLGGILALAAAAVAWVGSGEGTAAANEPLPGAALASAEVPADRRAIAVLPFASLSSDAENSYFADGMQDEILLRLAKIADLKVISRTSVMQYRDTDKNLRQIAQELGVASVLEGSVRRSGDRVRISPVLIDARTNEHLWAETYERQLADVFQIQSEIAQQIASALEARLSRSEWTQVRRRPTSDLAAYDFFLRGRDYLLRPGFTHENLEIAERLYGEAIRRDPSFVQAYADLTTVHGLFYFYDRDPTPRRVQLMQQSAEAALRLDPELPEAHRAMGIYHYWGRRDYEAALKEFEIARRGLPNDAILESFVASIYRRQGRWEQAVAGMRRATELDPLFPGIHYQTALTHRHLRRFAEAEAAYRQALQLAPDFTNAALGLGTRYVMWQGRTDTLRAALSSQPSRAALQTRWWLAMLERSPGEALRIAASVGTPVSSGQSSYIPWAFMRGQAYAAQGERARAAAAFDSARVLLEGALRERPEDARIHAALGCSGTCCAYPPAYRCTSSASILAGTRCAATRASSGCSSSRKRLRDCQVARLSGARPPPGSSCSPTGWWASSRGRSPAPGYSPTGPSAATRSATVRATRSSASSRAWSTSTSPSYSARFRFLWA